MVSVSSRIAKRFVFAVALTVFSSLIAQAADVYIGVKRKKGALIPLAVQQLQFKPSKYQKTETLQFGKTAQEILEFDMDFSGYFDVIKNRDMLNDIRDKELKTQKTNWQGWKDLGVQALIKGVYYIDKGGDIVTETRLFDVERKEQIVGTRYSGPEAVFRKMAHRFSDQVVYRFTGESGIAETRLTFISRTGGHKEIFVSDYDGQRIRQVTDEAGIVLSPDWSPKGTEIIYTTYRNNNPDVYILDLKTGKKSPVSRMRSMDSSATWSPDGKMIAFTMSTRGNADIYTIRSDGKDLQRLTWSSSIETSPSYSPDGKKIVYISDYSGSPQLYIMDTDGRLEGRLTYNGTYNADPAWSPRGDKIAYVSIADENFNIVIKNLRDKSENQLTLFMGSNEHPSWSPDGRHIVFSSTRTGSKQLYIMNENGENQRRITSMSGGAFSPSWSPR